ncbi:MAG: hypothetical protein WAU47_07675 [Desulfobaccales bacterium]
MCTEKDGPYLQVAVICEKALEEKDGVISIIRIIDRVMVTYVGHDVPEEMPETPVSFVLVASFKSGEFKGDKELKIVIKEAGSKDKDGKKLILLPLTFEGDEKGANVILNNVIQTKTEGVYWFEIFLDDKLYSKVPLRILYKSEKAVASAPPT